MEPRLHLFIIILLSALSFFGCNKIDTAGPTVADGKIVDATTGAGIPNATAVLIEKQAEP